MTQSMSGAAAAAEDEQQMLRCLGGAYFSAVTGSQVASAKSSAAQLPDAAAFAVSASGFGGPAHGSSRAQHLVGLALNQMASIWAGTAGSCVAGGGGVRAVQEEEEGSDDSDSYSQHSCWESEDDFLRTDAGAPSPLPPA